MSLGACSAPSKPNKRNLFLRIVDAIADSNRRKAERAVAAIWARYGNQSSDRGLS
jgi:hypothetical protein